jgi:ferrous iron transport protein B
MKRERKLNRKEKTRNSKSETENTELLTPLIALTGQPNSGKTTLFNYLSGKNYKTVNYPGSTVEYSISRILNKFEINAHILDSPGIISLIPSSPDEKISIDSLYSHPEYGNPDIVVVTVDSSQLSRHLFLVKQLLESNFKVIIVLTMLDLLHKKGFEISAKKLSEILKCTVVEFDGKSGKGVNDLLKALNHEIQNKNGNGSKLNLGYSGDKANLLNYYKEIEQIENEVIYKNDLITTNGKFDLSKINESIQIVNQPSQAADRHKPDEFTLKIDSILLHKFWGLIIFFIIMALTFTSIFWLAAPVMDLVDLFFGFLADKAHILIGENWLGDLVSNGIVSGVGSVLIFLPQIVILFVILGLLEDSGYLARGAMLVDKPLSKIGLNGKSFVPMLSGFACAIPAIMATRTISNKRERFLTIFILPLMSCSARLPVYALLIAFLIPQDKPWIGGITLAVIYIFSIFSSVTIAGIINKFQNKLIKEKDDSSFILELPAYRVPKLKIVLSNMVNNASQYVKKAGPIILYLSLILWFLTYFPDTNPEVNETGLSNEEVIVLKESERVTNSYASELGKLIEPVMKPIGLDWRVGVSLIATFAAREVFVSSMALIFKITGDDESIQSSLLNSMRSATIGDTGEPLFTTATIIGLIVFFVFAMQCLSTVAISKKETGSWRIPILQIIIFSGLAYLLAFIAVNGLRFLGVN